MKMKKINALILVLVMIISVFTGCVVGKSTSSNNESSQQTVDNASQQEQVDTQKVITVTVFRKYIPAKRPPIAPPRPLEYVREKFGIDLKYESVAEAIAGEKVALQFASETYLECYWELRPYEMQEWGGKGHLLPLGDYIDKVPNYRKLYTAEEWDYTYKSNAFDDGKLYYLPVKNPRFSNLGWIYNKSKFEQLGLTFPKTIEELYETLKKLKGGKADRYPWQERNGPWAIASEGIASCFRSTTWSPWYIDPDTNELSYLFAQDKFLDILRWIKKFIDEGLIPKEYLNDEAFQKVLDNAQVDICYTYVGNTPSWTGRARKTDPNANIEPSYTNISGYPGKPGLAYKYMPYYTFGPWFTDKMTQEKVERMLAFIDWTATKEGAIWAQCGEEGKEYELIDGKIKYLPHIIHASNPEGVQQLEHIVFGYTTRQIMGEWTVYGPDNFEKWGKVLAASKEYIDVLNVLPTPDEKKELDELDAAINGLFWQYMNQYLEGAVSDAAFDEYKNGLYKAGLDKAIEIRKKIYERSK